jgi:hypothetical protein
MSMLAEMRSGGSTYHAYGLVIATPLALPELIPASGAAEVTVEYGKVDRSRLEVIGEKQMFSIDAAGACYAYDGAGAFFVRDGNTITVDPEPNADERTLRLCLLGPALSLVLHQRGRFVLHGSAVVIRGRGIGFLGGSGWGKSTLAAACNRMGHQLITDDVLTIDFDGETPAILPSYPQLKLWPKAALALGERPENLSIVHPEFDKRARPVTQRFARSPVPIQGFYVLGRADVLAIRRLSPAEGLKSLLNYWYGRRFGSPWLHAIDQRAYFEQTASLAKEVPISCLLRPNDLASLETHVRLLEQDVRDAQ